jgi:hypothetical protein
MFESQVIFNETMYRLFGGLASMGKTVPAYRMALEFEINTWKDFRKALPKEEDRKAFDDLMDICRVYASESSMATNPIIFEPMVMSMLLGHQKKLCKLERILAISNHPLDEANKEPLP